MKIPHPFLHSAFKREFPDFVKNLSIMAKSGIPLDEALRVLAIENRSKGIRTFIEGIQHEVQQGVALSKALEACDGDSDSLVINVIKAGEVNGTLEENLQYLADLLDRKRELSQRIQSAMLYPEIVLVLAFLIGGGISIFVLPRLVPLFQTLGVKLPFVTQLFLDFSVFLRDNGLISFTVLTVVIFLLTLLARIPAVRWFLSNVSLRIPLIGRLIRDYQLALFSQIFGALFRSGLTIHEALSSTAYAMTNVCYQGILRKASTHLVQGVPLAVILEKDSFYFPQHVTALVSVGESSGKLDDSFVYLARYYNREVDMQTKRLPVLIEPLLLFFIGLIVLFLAVALISPIYEITSGIQAHSSSGR